MRSFLALVLASLFLTVYCNCPGSPDREETVQWSYDGTSLPNLGQNGEWFTLALGPYVANDSTASIQDGWLKLDSNPLTSVGLGVADHLKYAIGVATPFNVPAASTNDELILKATMRYQGFNVENHPFGAQVLDAQSDYRLASSAFSVLDFTSSLGFSFLWTNTRIWAFYERLDFSRAPYNLNYFSFGSGYEVATVTANQAHDLAITLNARERSVRWIVDGVEKFKIYYPGSAGSRENMVVDRGGIEVNVFPTSVQVLIGVLTSLDGYHPCSRTSPTSDGGSACVFPTGEVGLVNIVPPGSQFNPRTGADAQYLFDSSDPTKRVWGQGVEAYVKDVSVGVCRVVAPPQPPEPSPAPECPDCEPCSASSVIGSRLVFTLISVMMVICNFL